MALTKLGKYILLIGLVILLAVAVKGVLYWRALKLQPTPVVVVRPEETLKIIEGWTSRDIAEYLQKTGIWTSTDFYNVAAYPLLDYRQAKNKDIPLPLDFSAHFSFLSDKPTYFGLEGYLYPDTYRVYASSTVTEIIEKMLTNFDAKLTPQMRSDIKAQGKTVYEVITLASLIEKEAPIDYQSPDNKDAHIIGGIFLNRLASGQALQSDATLSYIYGDNKPAHSGAELDNPSLYNTYKYRGLPPGPICNPGIVAIEAAIYPTKTNYNYFLTTPDGQVIYARTYQEHLNNKYKYLK